MMCRAVTSCAAWLVRPAAAAPAQASRLRNVVDYITIIVHDGMRATLTCVLIHVEYHCGMVAYLVKSCVALQVTALQARSVCAFSS